MNKKLLIDFESNNYSCISATPSDREECPSVVYGLVLIHHKKINLPTQKLIIVRHVKNKLNFLKLKLKINNFCKPLPPIQARTLKYNRKESIRRPEGRIHEAEICEFLRYIEPLSRTIVQYDCGDMHVMMRRSPTVSVVTYMSR